MKIRHGLMSSAILALTLTLASASGAAAQDLKSNQQIAPASRPRRVVVTEQYVKDAELAIAERDHLRRQLEIKDAQLANLAEQNKALNALASIERLRADSLLKAVQERTTANQVDAERVKIYEDNKKLYEASLADYKAAVARVQAERDAARRANKWWAAAGFVVGALAGSQAGR